MSSIDVLKRIKQLLSLIYTKEESGKIFGDLKNIMDIYARNETIIEKTEKYKDRAILDEKDAILITYADAIYKKGEKPLRTLHRFLRNYIKEAVTGVHVLPFFPSSSDGGYAVINYKEVDPRLGTWDDIRRISKDYRLMVDLVINHVSSKSDWFQSFLRGDRRYRDYFIWSDKEIEMPEVFRPRENPLFTKFETAMGEKYVWTTFSSDQIDLNFRTPHVLLRMIDVLLFYLSQGVEIIRLDAIGYIWKKPHSHCVNLAKTHQIVKLLRAIMEYVAPYGLILTEANFPYKDNIAYFGERHEANIVYKFSLPPLVVDALSREDTSYIKKMTKKTRQDLLFFDFLASHDGIGLLSAKDILSKSDFDNLLRTTKAHNGLISYKLKNGGKEPYELNISYFDAINNPNHPNDPLKVKRFIASQAIMLALKGVPGIYIHSILGSTNYYMGVKESGLKRMINRERLPQEVVDASLRDSHSLRHQVLASFLHLLRVRRQIPSFHPSSKREVMDCDKRLLAIKRHFRGETIIVLINVSDDTIMLPGYKGKIDLISNTMFDNRVDPYGVYFLR